MKKVSFFAAAAAVTALVATPALAQDTAKPRSAMQGKTDKSKQIKPVKHSSKPMKQSARMPGRDGAYMRAAGPDRMEVRRDARNDRGWDNRSTGFWPADVVGGAIGTAGAVATTAVGTAGAIATAPFGGPYRDSYAYGPGYVDTYSYNGVAMPYSSNYAARNGFMCEPGTFIKGTRNICQ
ncbi:hypothetical protein HNQ36_002483 [Afipia massiliensis]|uniref:Lectin-like protein BA14k n=1 Tax=Afipia massiliensis TaxID=211460 RepID=A0A840MW01_9BRAD|nr:hypothetical protein [Afipia massiliensis]MBB5052509.1 hypothetical protein [Afipia massiliensis]